jgi:hypothetical protein
MEVIPIIERVMEAITQKRILSVWLARPEKKGIFAKTPWNPVMVDEGFISRTLINIAAREKMMELPEYPAIRENYSLIRAIYRKASIASSRFRSTAWSFTNARKRSFVSGVTGSPAADTIFSYVRCG